MVRLGEGGGGVKNKEQGCNSESDTSIRRGRLQNFNGT